MTAAARAADQPPLDLSEQRAQLGRVFSDDDVATAAPLRALRATFARKEAAPAVGEVLPPGWHIGYFVPLTPTDRLGKDGMPLDNGVLPPMPLPRRMHAGNRLAFHSPILVGDVLRCESEFSDLQLREGRSGPLIFAVQTRRIYTPRGLALTEENTNVFRGDEVEGPGPVREKRAEPQAPPAAWTRTLTPDPVTLFRHSAVTFNPHRIHYDRSHAADEGYPGLVVQGMFTGQCLLDLARDHVSAARFTGFSFRAMAPLFDSHPLQLCGRADEADKRIDLWAIAADGRLAMKAVVDLS